MSKVMEKKFHKFNKPTLALLLALLNL